MQRCKVLCAGLVYGAWLLEYGPGTGGSSPLPAPKGMEMKDVIVGIALIFLPFWPIALTGATDHYNRDPYITGVTIAFFFLCWVLAAILLS